MQNVRKILVPVDFSDVSRAAAHFAIALAEHFDPVIDILHVWELPLVLGHDALVEAPDREHHVSLAEYARERVHDAMNDFLAELDEDIKEVMDHHHSLHITNRVETGNPAEVILNATREGNYDLIVMGTHGRSGIAQLLMGSVTSRVIQKAHVPVVAVPPKEAKPAK